MKKLFLLACVASASVASFAQKSADDVVKFEKVNMLSFGAKAPTAKVMGEESFAKVKRSLANSLYYYRPAGSFFYGWDEETSGYRATIGVFPAFSNIVFENKSANATSTQWTLNGTDLTEYADEQGNLNLGSLSNNGSMYYAPTVSYGSSTFTFGEWNSEGSAIMATGMTNLCPVDLHGKRYGWGSLTDSYLYGSGTITTQSGDVRKCVALETRYEKPMSPLYLENVHSLAISALESPLPDNATLSLAFYEVIDDEGSTATEPFAVMTATKDDVTYLNQSNQTSYTTSGMVYFYNITFSAKGEDAFGNPVTEPVVIDKPYVMSLQGLDQDGVSIGFHGIEQIAEDRPYLEPTLFVCQSQSDSKYYSHYYSDTQIAWSFKGIFDHVEAIEVATDENNAQYTDFNQLRVSADGQTVTNVGYPSANYALLNTTLPWTDEETGENNYTADYPDWIEAVVGESKDGSTYVTFTCSALPAGVEGRAAKLYFTGKGYTSETPVYVLQGNATKEDADVSAISVVENNKANADGRMFNIAGQQVGKDFKGLVIKDGKKFMKK